MSLTITLIDRIAGDDGPAIIGVAHWKRVPRKGEILILDDREYEVRKVVWEAKSNMQATGGEKFYTAPPAVTVTVTPTLEQMNKDKAEGTW